MWGKGEGGGLGYVCCCWTGEYRGRDPESYRIHAATVAVTIVIITWTAHAWGEQKDDRGTNLGLNRLWENPEGEAYVTGIKSPLHQPSEPSFFHSSGFSLGMKNKQTNNLSIKSSRTQ